MIDDLLREKTDGQTDRRTKRRERQLNNLELNQNLELNLNLDLNLVRNPRLMEIGRVFNVDSRELQVYALPNSCFQIMFTGNQSINRLIN